MRRLLERIFPWLATKAKRRFPVKVERWKGIANAFDGFPENPRVLLLKVDHIGDFVTALEAFARLRAAWPKALITLVCGSWNSELARSTGLFDRIVAFDFYPPSHEITGPARVEEKLQAFAALGLGSFDLAIDLRQDEDTRPLLRAARSTFKAGFTTDTEQDILDIALPYTEEAARTEEYAPLHAETRLVLLAEAVLATFKARPNSVAERLAAGRVATDLLPPGPYVVVCASSGAPLKRWPSREFADLAARLAGEGYRIVLLGGISDSAEADAIAAALPQGAALNLSGRVPLENLAPLLADADLFVGLDTGVTHLAAYLGVATLAIYSGTCDPNIWMPRGPRVLVLRAAPVCSPCSRRELKDCKRAVPCIEEIRATQAFAAAQELLAPRLSRRSARHHGRGVEAA